MESKAEIRKRIRTLMKADDPAEGHAGAVWSAVEKMPEFMAAGTVLIYCALPDEVPTAEFIKRWTGKKRIVVPLVVGETLSLKEYDPAKMHPGYAGILEPDPDAEEVDPEMIEMAFIPGVAFDRSGNRLGRGKGFYDRLLPALKCPLAGVCRDFQVVEEGIPADPWDKSVDMVVTNIGVINSRNS